MSDVLQKEGVFALTVNGDSMVDAFIADGDMVLMEPVKELSYLWLIFIIKSSIFIYKKIFILS